MRKRVLNQQPGTMRQRWRLVAGVLVVMAAFTANSTCALGQSNLQELAQKVGVRVVTEGQSGDDHKNSAVRAIPFRALNATGTQRVNEVLKNCAQHRSLPQLQYVVEPGMYRYLVEHPDVAVSTWRAMGISKFQMWQTGPYEYEVSASDGSFGIADVIYRDPGQCLFICEGTYNSPLLPRAITASALILLRYSFVRATDGTMLVDQKMDAFVALPGNAAQTIAKLASPLTNVIMDRNVFEVSLYARMMSKAAMTEPGWVEQLASHLDGVMPQRRDELVALVQQPMARSRRAPRAAQSAAQTGVADADPQNSAEFRVFESSLSRMNEALPVVPVQPAVPVRSAVPPAQNAAARAPVRVRTRPTAHAASPNTPGRNTARSADSQAPVSAVAAPQPPTNALPPTSVTKPPANADGFQLQDAAPPTQQPIVETGPIR